MALILSSLSVVCGLAIKRHLPFRHLQPLFWFFAKIESDTDENNLAAVQNNQRFMESFSACLQRLIKKCVILVEVEEIGSFVVACCFGIEADIIHE